MTTAATTTIRSAWADRFRNPQTSDLIAEIDPQRRDAVEAMRALARGLRGVRESLSWCGIPWRWSLVYRARGDRGHPLLYISLDPSRPAASVPLPSEAVCRLEISRLSRWQREGIANGTRVGNVLWPEWELAEAAQGEEILALVRHRLDTLAHLARNDG